MPDFSEVAVVLLALELFLSEAVEVEAESVEFLAVASTVVVFDSDVFWATTDTFVVFLTAAAASSKSLEAAAKSFNAAS